MRIEEGTVRCRTGKYVPKNRTVLALLSMFWLRPKRSAKCSSGLDPVPHQDSTVLAVRLLSVVMSEGLYMCWKRFFFSSAFRKVSQRE